MLKILTQHRHLCCFAQRGPSVEEVGAQSSDIPAKCRHSITRQALGALIGLSVTRRLTRNMHYLHRRTASVSLTTHRWHQNAKMTPAIHLIAIATLFLLCYSYVELGQGQDNTPNYIPRIPVPRPWQLPPDEEMQVNALPSMITAIAPSTTMAANGTFETMYSMHYHEYFVPSRQGTGIFKRGVFASDPPIATCTPCGFQGTIVTPNATATSTSPTATCTLKTYLVCDQVSEEGR